MKTIIFLATIILAVAMISGYKQSAQNEKTEKFAKLVITKDSKGINKHDVHEIKSEVESFAQKKASERKPRILFILNNDTGQGAWAPSLWWSYHYPTTGQSGC
jgi:hypothetical protein